MFDISCIPAIIVAHQETLPALARFENQDPRPGSRQMMGDVCGDDDDDVSLSWQILISVSKSHSQTSRNRYNGITPISETLYTKRQIIIHYDLSYWHWSKCLSALYISCIFSIRFNILKSEYFQQLRYLIMAQLLTFSKYNLYLWK